MRSNGKLSRQWCEMVAGYEVSAITFSAFSE